MIYHGTLTLISPLHIGAANGDVGRMDFFTDRQALYPVNERRLVNVLDELGLVEHFINYSQNARPSLQDYLDRLDPAVGGALREKIITRRIPMTGDFRVFSFRPFISDLLSGELYLPGSSIKGALRNRIMFGLLVKDKSHLNSIMKRLAERWKVDKKRAGVELDDLFQSKLPQARKGPHRDWLRGLKISESFANIKDISEITETKVVSLNRAEGGFHFGAHRSSIYVQTVNPGVTFEFQMVIDNQLLNMMGSLELFHEMLNDPSKVEAFLEAEDQFWEVAGLEPMRERQDFYRKSGANLRLGWGSGYLNTSAGLHLDKNELMLIKKKYYKEDGYQIFPNSRKVVMKGSQVVDTLGWAKVELREV